MRIEFRREDKTGELARDRDARLAEHDARWPPEDIAYLWDWFGDLTDWRDSSMGVGPLSHLEIECWSRLMQVNPPISPFEVDVLRKLDRECRSYYAEKHNPQKPSIIESMRELAEHNAAEKAKAQKKTPKAKT